MTSLALSVQEQRAVILSDVAAKYTTEIAALAPRGTQPEHFIAALRLCLSQVDKDGNPTKLLDCTPASIARGILRVAQTGLDLGVSCDLLPFGKECQFNPRYNGIIDLAYNSGVKSIMAKVVRQGDAFEYEYGTEGFLRHRPIAGNARPITHAYAIATVRASAPPVFEVLSREEVDAIRVRYSKQWKSGSLDAIPWYAKKTAVRRLAPYLPSNPRLAAALQFAAEAEESPASGDDIEEGEFEIQPAGDDLPESWRQVPAPTPRASSETTPVESSTVEGDMTFAEAMTVALVGPPESWGGKGGQLLHTFSGKHLESIRKWCATKLEQNEGNADAGLQRMVDAITLILIEHEKDQTSMDLKQNGAKPAITDPFPAAMPESNSDRAARVAGYEASAQAVGL